MGKYRKKVLQKTSITLRQQKDIEEESKDNGVLGLQQISTVSAKRVGQIVKRKNANVTKACSICGRKFGSNWAQHWKKAHHISRKNQMKSLAEGECPYDPDWVKPVTYSNG